MKIFVTGATGVLGRRAVALLCAHGHDVSTVARTTEKVELLEKLGSTPLAVDVLDPAAVEGAVAGHEVVINLATHIPSPARIAFLRAWRENDRLRSEASRNLVEAALATGAQRYIQESVGFFYADRGATWVDEESSLDLPPHAATTSEAESQVDRFTRSGGIGVALRFGLFYCGDSPQNQLQVRMARMGLSPFFGGKNEYQSVIHVDDAASAVVAGLQVRPGAFNVVDDEPLTKGESADVLARALGRKRLVSIPRPMLALGGRVTRALMRSQRVSNKKFRDAARWAPRYPSARDGLPALVEQVSEALSRGR